MLMEFAEVRLCFLASSAFRKQVLTMCWQSSNVPSTSRAEMLPPRVVSCFSWRSLTPPLG